MERWAHGGKLANDERISPQFNYPGDILMHRQKHLAPPTAGMGEGAPKKPPHPPDDTETLVLTDTTVVGQV